MAKSRGVNGLDAPGSRESLAGAPGEAGPGDELSSLGSDSEINGGGGERRVDKFGFIVGSQTWESRGACLGRGCRDGERGGGWMGVGSWGQLEEKDQGGWMDRGF
uniref:Uncharacterized protein n=1 Tax=Chrysemys picta bellii TaxID=8478 RepID=A0A8C3HC54_CHRPI